MFWIGLLIGFFLGLCAVITLLWAINNHVNLPW